MKSKIICITGNLSSLAALLLQSCYVSFGHSVTLIKVGTSGIFKSVPEKIIATASSIQHAQRNKSPDIIILTGFPENLVEAGKFFDALRADKDLPQQIFALYTTNEDLKRNEQNLAVEYMQSLLQESDGGAGIIVHKDGLPAKLLITMLSLMAKFHQKVVVCGTAVSGKTTITKGINNLLGYELFSVGNDVTRIIAEKKSIPLDDVVKLLKTDKVFSEAYDNEADDYNKFIITEKEKFVLESRLGALWGEKECFKVLLKIDSKTAGIRLYDDIVNNPDTRNQQRKYGSAKEAGIATAERNEADRKRYIDKYDRYDFTDESHYNWIIDSVQTPKDMMVMEFMRGYTNFLLQKIG